METVAITRIRNTVGANRSFAAWLNERISLQAVSIARLISSSRMVKTSVFASTSTKWVIIGAVVLVGRVVAYVVYYDIG